MAILELSTKTPGGGTCLKNVWPQSISVLTRSAASLSKLAGKAVIESWMTRRQRSVLVRVCIVAVRSVRRVGRQRVRLCPECAELPKVLVCGRLRL